ncbi:hypothetical protein D7D52_09870 [Nocardia yunnanensis]|uniref:Secreted protein n=1 Tax=Nocardia yunnanensis TaxID=2382165 RepID=A0A386Z8J0_9NOCA|nr:hypothetical protein [Nocardia yunnanensis]AYF74122.1 hypothetical protein D7D52_09870 [Nocardia yunnanensis]
MMGTIIRTTTAAAVGCAAFATVAALAAPAGATATRVGIDPGISFGSATNYGTGCSYDLDGRVDDPVTPVVFYDNSVPIGIAKPSGAVAQLRWTPTTVGLHRIQIWQYHPDSEDVFPYVDIFVGVGLPSGSGCAVMN